MKERWKQLAGRFDALAVRERVLIAVAVVATAGFLFHVLVIEPELARKKRLTREIAEVRTSVKAAETQLQAWKQQADPDAPRRAHRDALRRQIAEIDKEVKGLYTSLVPPAEMAKLLQGVLSRNRGLQLVSLQKLPMQRLEQAGAAPKSEPAAPPPGTAQAAKPAPDAKTATEESTRGVYQHSFEVTIQGSYAELHDYLERLERLPWRMFWNRLNVNAERHPNLILTLTIHTLSLDKAWLIV